MSYLYSALLQKQQELKSIINNAETSIQNIPGGNLRISHSGGYTQYYHVTDNNNKTGRYIKKENFDIAKNIAQNEYEKKILCKAQKSLKRIEAFMKKYQSDELERVYENLSSGRKEIVMPKILTDERFIKEWSSIEYEKKCFLEGEAEIYTDRGERVRSKSEKIIADMLKRMDIPYRYEYPVYLKTMGIVHPDFIVLNIRKRKEIYWEHMGMMDNAVYCEKALYKINCYERNGLMPGDKLLISHETSKSPLDTKIIKSMIQNFLL